MILWLITSDFISEYGERKRDRNGERERQGETVTERGRDTETATERINHHLLFRVDWLESKLCSTLVHQPSLYLWGHFHRGLASEGRAILKGMLQPVLEGKPEWNGKGRKAGEWEHSSFSVYGCKDVSKQPPAAVLSQLWCTVASSLVISFP